MKLMVTGGCGFIGSSLIRHFIKNTNDKIINIDKLTYASNPESLLSVSQDSRYVFEQCDIIDREKVKNLIKKYEPDSIINLAAETHVDRSIKNPREFINSNIIGTFVLLNSALSYWENLNPSKKKAFRFHHVSTDEVFGSLTNKEMPFKESSQYKPNSPYSATKASSDHLVRSWHKTYGLPTIVTNCSNNYGPYQYIEKFIPLVITNAMRGKKIPIYGSGLQIRDWLYVDDHSKALDLVLKNGKIGETYNIGGNCEQNNLFVVNKICEILEKKIYNSKNIKNLIEHVVDRPGHDERYAIDTSKIYLELGWEPKETFETGLEKTVNWYLKNCSM